MTALKIGKNGEYCVYNRDMECPKCHDTLKQYKNGKTASGSQRYRCFLCQHSYTPNKKAHGYDAKFRRKAIYLYIIYGVTSFRRIGQELNIDHQTVANWVKEDAKKCPGMPVPKRMRKAEMDRYFQDHKQ